MSWAILADIVSEPDLAFIGVMNLRGSEQFVRLVRAADGSLLLQTLVWPEELASRESVTVNYPEDMLAKALQLVEINKTEFDPGNYRSLSRARHAALVHEMLLLNPPSEVPSAPVAVADPASTLMSQLEAALAQAQTRKSA